METDSKEIIRMTINRHMAFFFETMERPTKAIMKTILGMGLVNIYGKTEKSMLVFGKKVYGMGMGK